MPHYSGDFELLPAIFIEKGPRQSRDLAEYVAIAYLNILKLEVVAELELLKVGLIQGKSMICIMIINDFG